MSQLTPLQSQILEKLGHYKFLCPSQIVALGLSKNKRYIADILREMVKRSKPLIGVDKTGVEKMIGKREYLYHLHPRGKKYLIQDLNHLPEDIKAPINPNVRVGMLYWHRKYVIDFEIALNLWADEQDIAIEFFDRDFDKVGNSRRDKDLRAKTRVELVDGRYFIPDANFMLDTITKGRKLYCLEMHNDKNTKKLIKQLKNHIRAIELASPTKKYNFNKANRVLVLFQYASIKKATLERIKGTQWFAEFTNYFLFKTLDELKADGVFHKWSNVEGQLVRLV